MPDVTGMDEATAISTINAVPDISYGTSTYQCSNTVPAGDVISQSITGTAPCGTAVDLVVSTGLCPVTVPNVVDTPQASAEAAIIAAGLTVGTVTTTCDNSIVAGNVISQNPAGGTSQPPGTAVNLVVSTGPCPVTVPSVVDTPQASAEAAIVATGLTVGTVTTACDNSIVAGNVISQNPAGGTSQPPGTAVNLVVSLGQIPEIVYVDVNATSGGDNGQSWPMLSFIYKTHWILQEIQVELLERFGLLRAFTNLTPTQLIRMVAATVPQLSN